MKKKIITALILIVLAVGLGFLLYPTASDWLWDVRHDNEISSYNSQLELITEEQRQQMLEEARQYNEQLLASSSAFSENDSMHDWYESLLNEDGNGMMGTITIPKLDISLPLYHGSDDDILQKGAGHLEGSSLPVGGLGTHTVISGHNGLPSAKLFTGLEELEAGDLFCLTILGEQYVYQVDHTQVVLPEDIGVLTIDPDLDQATLITCVPYGVNSHRLLVTGYRVDASTESEFSFASASPWQKPFFLGCAAVAAVLIVWLIVHFVRKKKKAKADH